VLILILFFSLLLLLQRLLVSASLAFAAVRFLLCWDVGNMWQHLAGAYSLFFPESLIHLPCLHSAMSVDGIIATRSSGGARIANVHEWTCLVPFS